MLEEVAEKLGKPLVEFMRRADGRIEWMCEHGIGHTVWYPEGSDAIHGCDGCCKELKKLEDKND